MAHPLRLAILGSTGSIGQQTLDIVRSHPDCFEVVALSAGNNATLLAQQVAEFKPPIVWHLGSKLNGPEDMMHPALMASLPEADIVVIAMSGEAGLLPTLAAAKAGKRIALANKESLVEAGEIIISEARRSGATILPIDSEHSAIWQCLLGETSKPCRIILTASGGPFRGYTLHDLAEVTSTQALRHPSWNMGKKVTIDSATLMNKGLEVIEAHWLFDVAFERIQVVVHPQSIVHSMVEFDDGAVKAQLGCPDMRLPIQYALSFPKRLRTDLPRLEFASLRHLDFEDPDPETFPCLRLAIDAGQRMGTFPAVLSAADETAVGLFLQGRIRLTEIPRLIEGALNSHEPTSNPSVEDILAAATAAREHVLSSVARS